MMAAVRRHWRVWQERIDAMKLRERALIFIALLAVLYLVATHLVFGPLLAQRDALARALKDKEQEIASIQRQIQALVTQVDVDPASPERRRLAELEARRKALDESLARTTGGLVAPREMARLVEQVLARNRRLEVLRLESLPPTAIDGPAAGRSGAPASTTEAAGAGIYKHGMRIELKGRYFDIVEYLRTLERLPWKVFWGEVRLESERYPFSRLTLQIYTLSTHRGWIGT